MPCATAGQTRAKIAGRDPQEFEDQKCLLEVEGQKLLNSAGSHRGGCQEGAQKRKAEKETKTAEKRRRRGQIVQEVVAEVCIRVTRMP